MKKQKKTGHDTDKALAKVAKEKLHTDEPLSEKDEVKQAEEHQRERMKGK